MPFHLTPDTRRAFLRRSLAAAAGMLALPALRMSGASVDASRWALLSDPHIAADPSLVFREVGLADHLRKIVTEIGAFPSAPVGLLLNGDCALDHGLPEDYATFTELLRPIRQAGIPIHLTLGNHDDREVFWAALQDMRAATPPVASKHLSIVESPLANWFLLDSLEVTKQTPGRLGDEQRAWLVKALDAHADKPALVLVHHNPVLNAPPKNTGLLDSAELLEVLTPRRQVKALFYGHTHTWRQTAHEGIHLINLPAVAYPFQADELTGWVDCQLRADGATLDPHAHDPAHPLHRKSVELAWRSA